MFTVYKITNLINNHCYIGSSVNVEKRWNQHKNTAFNINSKQYNYPLYQAFRKYGVENFSFEVLKDNFDSIVEMQSYEYQAILYFDSYKNGYNQTLNTFGYTPDKCNPSEYIKNKSQKCAKVDKNNNILEIYSSYHDAARKNNLDADTYASKIRKICKGQYSALFGELIFRDLDNNNQIIKQNLKQYRQRKSLIAFNRDDENDILFFSSISEAAIYLKTERKSIQKCIQGSDRYSHVKNYIFRELDIDGNIIELEKTVKDRLQEYDEKNPVINGERHNITEWCSIFNISKQTYYNRKKKGMSTIEALTYTK